MEDVPERIVLARHRDLEGLAHRRWIRWAAVAAIGAVLALGLANAFGQHPKTFSAASDRADLELTVPTRVRGGLLYQARFTIRARRELRKAELELSSGWAENQQMNTVAPSPIGEGSRDGNIVYTLGHIPKGHVFRLYMQFQVNPTNVARRHADVTLYDGGARLLTVERTITVFP